MSSWSMLQGQMHGVCGNYNQQTDDEYKLPFNNTVESHFNNFDLNAIVPMGNCNFSTLAQSAMLNISIAGLNLSSPINTMLKCV